VKRALPLINLRAFSGEKKFNNSRIICPQDHLPMLWKSGPKTLHFKILDFLNLVGALHVRKLPLLWQIPHSHLVDSGA